MNSFNPNLQLKGTEYTIENKLINSLFKLRGIKFVTTLVLMFKKIENYDETKYTTFYSNSKTETIINKSDVGDIFESIYTTIISNIQKYLAKGSGWITDSAVDHVINISKFNDSNKADISYIKLPKELNHSKESFD